MAFLDDTRAYSGSAMEGAPTEEVLERRGGRARMARDPGDIELSPEFVSSGEVQRIVDRDVG